MEATSPLRASFSLYSNMLSIITWLRWAGMPDAGARGAKCLCTDLLLPGQVWVQKHHQ